MAVPPIGQQMRNFGSHGAERRSLQQLQELASNHAPEVNRCTMLPVFEVKKEMSGRSAVAEEFMQTLIGSFDSRAGAEKVIKELLNLRVPKDSITLLTTEIDSTSDADSKGMGKVAGAFVGGVLGTAAATLLVPGIGPVLAIGVGAAALLGLGGAGAAVGHALEAALDHEYASRNTSEEDAALFRKALKQRRSLLIVRVDSDELARAACGVLDRTGLGMSA